MNKVNWWMIATLILSALIVLLVVAVWVTQDWISWEPGRTMAHGWSIWRAWFAPFMFFMPLVCFALPILGIICMIRWLSGGAGCGKDDRHG